MNQIFQSQKAIEVLLQNSIAIILSQNQSNQSVIIYEFNRNLFKEYLIRNFKVQKVVSDPNMQFLLMFEENKENQGTIMHMAKLEKSFIPITTIILPSNKIQLIEWCNSNICAIVFQNDIILFNIYSQTVLKQIESNCNSILQFKVNQKFDTILQQYQVSKLGNQICYVMPLEDLSQKTKFENCIACCEIIENEEHLIMIKTNNNMIKLIIAKFDKEIKIKYEIIQNGIQIAKNTSFLLMKYRKDKQELLIIDSTKNLQLFNLDNSYKMIATKSYSNVSSFVLSLQNQQLIYVDENKCLYQEGVKVEESKNLPSSKAELSVASQVKKSAIQGILSRKNKSGSLKEIIKQYSSNFEEFTQRFSQIINLKSQYKSFPLVEYKVLISPQQEINKNIKYVPDMSEYVETQSVKKHLKQFEIALKGDNPLLCEGDAACGKTSVIQYLAYKYKQPLLIMNLNSFTQISDLIGKIEILPGFKLEFQTGPFARAVQEGMWILLDEANLASDSILRVIEDVLELGYLTIFGNSINSHNDLIDGILTIRKHQNFKLFLTQNPATDQNFAGSRHVFSPSLMSQFIQISFESMSENDMQNIIGQIISKKLQNLLPPEQQLKLITLIMKIYLEIKQNKLDEGLFTLRDILQILDAVSLEPNYKNILHKDILPINYCLKLIITQFLDSNKNQDMIQSLINEFNFIGYSNKDFEETQDKRIEQLVIWSQEQQELYLSFHSFLFAMLTLCYRTKRAALVIGQQFCGKLSSLKLWLKLQGISNYEVFELSEDTTSEDLFGKYQPSEKGFKFVEGSITRCFSQGKILILLDIDAPESALTESLNGILEKKFLQLIVQNQKYERHKDFHIIAISSDDSNDKSKIKEKFTPALKSRFLSGIVKFQVKIQDVCSLFRQANLPGDKIFVQHITKKLGLDDTQQEHTIPMKNIIRFLLPIKQFLKFVTQYLKQNISKSEAVKRVIDCVEFFVALSLEDNKKLYSDQIKLPLQFEDMLEGSFEDASKKFTFTPSRKRVSDIIAIAIASKVPLILQGSAGVGKTKIISMFSQTCRMFQETQFYYINMNQNTDINDLMGQFVCSCNKGEKEFIFEKGLLFSAMEKGGIALVDEVNLSQSSVLNILASIAKYPTEFIDPVSNFKIQINENFRIFFAQNPPHYIGRSQLPQKLASKVIIVEVPNYTFKEVLQICQGTSSSIQQGMEYFLTNIITYPEDGDEKKLKYNNIQFTLRQFIKFRNRLEKTKFEVQNQNWQKLLILHQQILYPKNKSEQNSLIPSISYCEKEQLIHFQIRNNQTEIKVSLNANQNLNNSQIKEILNLNQQQKLLLSQIAFCFYCKENALIEGDTTFKTYITRLFSCIIQFENPNPFELIYTSSVTEIADLIGNTESHNQESYKMHCRHILRKLGASQELQNLDQINLALNKKAQLSNQKLYFDQIIQNLNNQFPFVERGLTFSARFGGVVCLKNITLADQSVLEGLNALLEIEPLFVVNGKKIDIHKQFIVIALLNSNFGNSLSDALQSRLTKISIQTYELLNSKNQLQESYQKFITTKIPMELLQNDIINFCEQLLGFLKKYKFELYTNLSSRKFYQWMNFLQLNITAPNLQQLALGFQFVILDQKKENFEQLIKNETWLTIYKNAQISMKKYLEKQGIYNSSKIIMNPTTNKIIERIFSAFSVSFIPCLIGPPGIGKSAIAQEVAQILGKEFQRVCCSDSLSVDDLFGSYAPTFDGGKAGFTFQEGYLAMALKKESLILFYEINLASPEVLSTLQALFNMDEKSICIKDYNINKTGCVFLCSMNPPSYQGRQQLPQCIQYLLCDIHLQQFSVEEILDIFKQSYHKEINNLKDFDIDFLFIVDLHKELSQLQDKNQSSNYDFNIRFLQNLLQLFSDDFMRQRNLIQDQQLKTELIILCLEIIYVEHYYQTDFSVTILETILTKYGKSLEQWKNRKVFLEQKANMLFINRLVDNNFNSILKYPITRLVPPQMINNSYTINFQNSKILEKMLIALQSQKIILCQGDTSAGKTSSIIALASKLNQRFILLPINCDLEADDLLGNFAIVQDNYDEVQQELSKLIKKQNIEISSKDSQKSDINMKYIEGVLKICLKHGYWLILDNINLARPEIIERLNSLGEDSPCLFINEFGDCNGKITPHQQFRLICIQNPSRAESHQLSPAFYNRCLKVNFKIDIIENTQDIIEILVKNGEQSQLFQEETVNLAEKFLSQIRFMKDNQKCNFSFRQIQKSFKMIQENGLNNYDQVMKTVFGLNYQISSQNPQFPIFNENSYMNPDQLLKKMISNSLSVFDSETENQILQLQNLYQLFCHFLHEGELKMYEHFVELISRKINLVNFQMQNLFNTGNYELNVSGQIEYDFCGIMLIIEPLLLSLTFRNNELQSFSMKIQCQFLKQKFQAEIKLNSNKKFEILFTNTKETSIANMIEQLIGSQQVQLFETFKQILEGAMYECQVLLNESQEIKFNFNLDEFSLFQLPMLKLKNIVGQFTLSLKKQVQFHMNFQLYLFNVYVGNLRSVSSLKAEIEIQPERLINIFKDYGCYYLLQNLELKQLQNENSYFDFQKKKLEFNIGSQNPIQIFKLPFFVKFNKIHANIHLLDQIIIKGSLHCAFQWQEKDVCTLKAFIDNQNKQMFKLELDQEQPQQNLKYVLHSFFEQYFETNYFIKKLDATKDVLITKLDMITNTLSWNFQIQTQLNLSIQIINDISLELKSIDLHCHVGSNKCEFVIVSTIEFFKFIMEIRVEIDFFKLFTNQRQKSLKMIFRKAKNCPTFKEILSFYFPAIDRILEKIPGYKELKIKDKIQDLSIENSEDLLDLNKFTKLGSSIFEEFKQQANERYEDTNKAIKEQFELKGKDQFSDVTKQTDKEISKWNQTIQNAKTNLEKKINCQISQQIEKVENEALSQQENSKQSYLEFKNNSIQFKFGIPLLDEWKIFRFLTLYECNLQINYIENKLNLDLKGKIKFLDIPLPEFSLQFTKKPLILSFDKTPLENAIDPIQLGLKLFDQKIEEINLFPKIKQINAFIFNFETYEFESELSLNMENCLPQNKLISFSTFLMRITSKQQLNTQNQEIKALLKTTIQLFELNINLNLDFSQLAKINTPNTNFSIIFESEPIKNFSFNQFVKNIVQFEILKDIASFEIQTINCQLLLEKKSQWEFLFLVRIVDGCCYFFQDLIRLQNLQGQLIYSQEQGWKDSKMDGDFYVKEQKIGHFVIEFLQNQKKIEVKLNSNENFSLEQLISDLSKNTIQISIFQAVNFSNLFLTFEILELSTCFKAVYKLDILEFDAFPFIKLKNIIAEFQVQNQQKAISREFKIDFYIEVFSFWQINGNITELPFEGVKFNYPLLQQQDILQIFDILREFNLLDIPKFQLFENLNISVNLQVEIDKNMNMSRFGIEGTYKGKFDWSFLKITELSLQYSRKNGKNNFTLQGQVILVDVYNLLFEYDSNKKTLKFSNNNSLGNNQHEINQLTKSLYEDQKYSEKIISNFGVMSQKIPQFKELVINFKDRSLLLELLKSSSQVYKIYLHWQSKTLLFYFSVNNQSFGNIMSWLKVLDQFLCIQQAECLLIYSKENVPQDEIIQGEQNKLLNAYFQNQNKKSSGFHLSTKTKFKINQKFCNFFSFLKNPKMDFDLSFQADFANGFEYISEKHQYTTEQFQGSLQYYAKCNDITSLKIDFGVHLLLKYVTNNFGELTFEGNVNVNLQKVQFEGDFQIYYKDVFGIENWDISGQAKLCNSEIQSKISTEIFEYKINLYLSLKNFTPNCLGFMMQNVSLIKILQFFQFDTFIPQVFLDYIPKIHKLGVIFGEIPNNNNLKSLLPKKLSDLLNSKPLFGQLINNLTAMQTKLFLIESSSELENFIFDLALYLNCVELQFYCKGDLCVDISPYFLIQISVETQLQPNNFEFEGKGTLEILKQEIKIKALFKWNQFFVNVKIKLGDMKFKLQLKALLEEGISITGELQFQVSKNKSWLNSLCSNFSFINIQELVIKLEISNKIECILEYSIEIKYFKTFENSHKISFDFNLINTVISLTFQLFIKFLSMFPELNKNSNQEEFQRMIDMKSQMVKQFCQAQLNTDVSNELEYLKNKFNQDKANINNSQPSQSNQQNPPLPPPTINKPKQKPSAKFPNIKKIPPLLLLSQNNNQNSSAKPVNIQKGPDTSPNDKQDSLTKPVNIKKSPDPLPKNKQDPLTKPVNIKKSPDPLPKNKQDPLTKPVNIKKSPDPSPKNKQDPITKPVNIEKISAPSSSNNQKKPSKPFQQDPKPSNKNQPSSPENTISILSKNEIQNLSTLTAIQNINPFSTEVIPQQLHFQFPLPQKSIQDIIFDESLIKQPKQIITKINYQQNTLLKNIQKQPQQNNNDLSKFIQQLNEQEAQSQKVLELSQVKSQDQQTQQKFLEQAQKQIQESEKNHNNNCLSTINNKQNQNKIDLDLIYCLKRWNFDEDLKSFNITKIQKQQTNIASNQQTPELSRDQNENSNCNYEMLLNSAEAEIANEWKNEQQKHIIPMIGRIIINDQNYGKTQLLQLGHLLLKLQFLHQKFDVILSGKCDPVFLKKQEIPISINLIAYIFHVLNGKCNEQLIPVELNNKAFCDFLIFFTENTFTISDQCKEELINDGITEFYLIDKEKVYNLEVKSEKKKEVSQSFLEIFSEISQNKKKEDKLKIIRNINYQNILSQNIQDLSSINIKQTNNLKSLLEISKYTKYSLSSKGTTIDIKGIIKFFCTNGTAKDIMKKKNKGGKSLYVFQVVLDLYSFSIDSLIKIIVPFIYKLIELCKEYKIVCNLSILSDPIIDVKQNFSTIWTQEEQEQLLNRIADFKEDIKSVDNCNLLKIVSDQLSIFNQYKKYLIFINHQLYNYSYQDLSKFINQAQLQQIQLVSIGVDVNKQTNRSMEGIFHFPLIDSDDLYQIIKDLFEKKIQQNLKTTSFQFEIENKRFPSELQLQSFQSNGQNKNLYLNRYFNYIQNDDQQQQTFTSELIVKNSIFQVDNCSAIAINKNCSMVVAGYFNKIKVFKLQQEKLIETQLLMKHQGKIVVLNFMKQSNQFISGSKDTQIIVWSMNTNNQWIFQTKLIGHTDTIQCLVLNNNEDLIVSGSNDQTIKFWKKNISWVCQQTIKEHTRSVTDLSINQQQNQVISCGKDGQVLIINYSQQNSQWIIIQRITEDRYSRLCFIDNDLFALIENFGKGLDIYENNLFNKQFQLKQSMGNFHQFWQQQKFESSPYLLQYIKSKGMLVNKVGNQLQFLRINKSGKFYIDQCIKLQSSKFIGKLSDDGQYIVFQDSQILQIRMIPRNMNYR